MDSEGKFWITFWLIVGLTLSSVAWAVAWGTTAESREAAKAGLVQVEYPQVTTYTGVKWVKP